MVDEVESVARIIDPQTWYDRDRYVTLMTQSRGCHPVVIAHIADARVAESVRKARAVLTALQPKEPEHG